MTVGDVRTGRLQYLTPLMTNRQSLLDLWKGGEQEVEQEVEAASSSSSAPKPQVKIWNSNPPGFDKFEAKYLDRIIDIPQVQQALNRAGVELKKGNKKLAKLNGLIKAGVVPYENPIAAMKKILGIKD
jgi:hypothetical protein